MKSSQYVIEENQLFSQSKIWQFNRAFYSFKGVKAFSEHIVPHHLTSNSFVGKTYAELIFAFLNDLANKGKIVEPVYILELGAGHGRLAFHVLTHLKGFISASPRKLPPFCYIVSDIVEENLKFFENHQQFAPFIQSGMLDVAYFDALESQNIYLRISNKMIAEQELNQPIIAIANYFFDSIPSDLFYIQNKVISSCNITITSNENPEVLDPSELIKAVNLTYENIQVDMPMYENSNMNALLELYRDTINNSYLFFPEKSLNCIDNIKKLSKEGLFVLSLDKGFHELAQLDNRTEKDVVTHGSFSIWVNYHALGAYCEMQEGVVHFPAFSTFHLELAAILYLKDASKYARTGMAYSKFVDDFGPDDFNTLKQMTYAHIANLNIKELISLIRLSAYDSAFFEKLLPRLRQLSQEITIDERKRIAETMEKVISMHFAMGEKHDMIYEMAGFLYDLGFYNKALHYFQHSQKLYGNKPDTLYNIALTYYQLRMDSQFIKAIASAKTLFPENEIFNALEQLDLN